jgi:hypothetical protein
MAANSMKKIFAFMKVGQAGLSERACRSKQTSPICRFERKLQKCRKDL